MEESASRNLARLTVEPKSGSEPFHVNGEALGLTLYDFWRWSVSDLVSNATRGRLAEFIVANALGVAGGVRDEWSAYDLMVDGIKVEVKSAAYIQSWHQTKPSLISFRVPKTHAFDPDTNSHSPEKRRQADVYVFAILAHEEKSSVDPLNVEQWRFYVVPTSTLDARTRSQYGITLPTLTQLTTKELAAGPLSFHELKSAVLSLGRMKA